MELFWVADFADFVNHTWAGGIQGSTGAMDHVSEYNVPKWLTVLFFLGGDPALIRVRGEFSTDKLVHFVRCPWSVLVFEDEEEVTVRQASFLPLNYPEEAHGSAKDVAMCDVMHDLIFFEFEDPGYQVWPVLGCLTGSEVVFNLRPAGIAGDGDEEIWLSQVADYGHSILKLVSVPAWTTLERAGKDDSSHSRLPFCLQSLSALSHSILEVFVGVSP